MWVTADLVRMALAEARYALRSSSAGGAGRAGRRRRRRRLRRRAAARGRRTAAARPRAARRPAAARSSSRRTKKSGLAERPPGRGVSAPLQQPLRKSPHMPRCGGCGLEVDAAVAVIAPRTPAERSAAEARAARHRREPQHREANQRTLGRREETCACEHQSVLMAHEAPTTAARRHARGVISAIRQAGVNHTELRILADRICARRPCLPTSRHLRCATTAPSWISSTRSCPALSSRACTNGQNRIRGGRSRRCRP